MNNIRMNTKMTKAILDDRKTQTRRTIANFSVMPNNLSEIEKMVVIDKVAKYQVNEIVWVKEPAEVIQWSNDTLKMELCYKADKSRILIDIPARFLDKCDFVKSKWIKEYHSIPNGCIKEMARIFIKITNVRVEKLQDISDEDCIKEGIECRYRLFNNYIDHTKGFIADKQYGYCGCRFSGIKMSFFTLISRINTEEFVQDNPYVFVYEFKRVNKDGSDYE